MLNTLEGYLPTCNPANSTEETDTKTAEIKKTETETIPYDEEKNDKGGKGDKGNNTAAKDTKNKKNKKKINDKVSQETTKNTTKLKRKKDNNEENNNTSSINNTMAANCWPQSQSQSQSRCSLTLDIISTSCLYLMSIFFIVGSAFLLPNSFYNDNRPNEPYVFWILGVIAFLTSASIDLYKEAANGNGTFAIVMACLALLSGALWFAGSIFLFQNTMNIRAWTSLWILGSFIHLISITCTIIKLLYNTPKPLFHTIALGLSWIANLLLLAGTTHLAIELKSLNTCETFNAAGVLISAGVIYLLHSIFHTLSLFKSAITFSVQFASSA